MSRTLDTRKRQNPLWWKKVSDAGHQIRQVICLDINVWIWPTMKRRTNSAMSFLKTLLLLFLFWLLRCLLVVCLFGPLGIGVVEFTLNDCSRISRRSITDQLLIRLGSICQRSADQQILVRINKRSDQLE